MKCSRGKSHDWTDCPYAYPDGLPYRLAFMSSPESLPMSPITLATNTSVSSLSRSLGSNSINEMITYLRQLQLNKVKSIHSSWNLQVRCSFSGLGSPWLSMTQSGYFSLPSTLTKPVTQVDFGYVDD
ncbi:zinc finger CCCH domain-containing protein 20-like [Forsythia ovata]|uniref:Zinc finger CCCH domain-containing protein 20-like n=1 Tax=Forsythia ovata TaxID=205694 RepID=A0ABD1QCY8_9LAMI